MKKRKQRTNWKKLSGELAVALKLAHADRDYAEDICDELHVKIANLQSEKADLEDDVLKQSLELAKYKSVKHSCHTCGQTHGAECHAKEQRA